MIYGIYSIFMGTKNKVVSIDKGLAIEFSKIVSAVIRSDPLNEYAGDIKVTLETGNGEIQVQIRQESSTYTGIRSTIASLYREEGVHIQEVMNTSLILYIKDYHRMNFLSKLFMGLRFNERNKHVAKEVYSKISKILFHARKQEYVFAHFIFILDW